MKNENIRKKKSLKGMTLAEVIISLAILAVMTVVLVGVSGLIDQYTKSANSVNKRTAAQVPIAESKEEARAHRTAILDDDDNPVIGADGNPTFEEARIVFSYTSGEEDRTSTVKGVIYDVDDPASIDPDAIGGRLNMRFFGDLEYEVPETPAEDEESEEEESEE